MADRLMGGITSKFDQRINRFPHYCILFGETGQT
jgi:hypothetical protein